MSHPQDQVLINLLSIYSSFLALQAQHAARGYYKVTIPVLRESQVNMPMEAVEDYIPSPPPTELAQPPKAGTNYEPASKTSPPQDEPDQQLDSHVSETILSKSLAPGLTVTWTTSHSFRRGNVPT
jgi:hypothetical protein